MSNLTHDQLSSWIGDQSKLLYPSYFDDVDQQKLAPSLAENSLAFLGNRTKRLSNDEAKQISLYFTLMMMWSIDHMDGVPTDFKAGSIQMELTNGNNPFANLLKPWLELLGWNVWRCQFL